LVLVEEQCRRLGLVDASGEADLREMSRRAGLANTTVRLSIVQATRPSTKLLLGLEQLTGVAIDVWLESLGLLVRSDLDMESLSPNERRLLAFARQKGEAWIARTLEWFESLDSGRVADPRP
jgi:hypothetical protein